MAPDSVNVTVELDAVCEWKGRHVTDEWERNKLKKVLFPCFTQYQFTCLFHLGLALFEAFEKESSQGFWLIVIIFGLLQL